MAPLGSGEFVVMVRVAGWMVIESGCVAVSCGTEWSATLTVKFAVPTAFGVPVMAPVIGSNVRFEGSDPELTDQVYGNVPPAACTAVPAGYGTPTVPLGRELVTIESGAGAIVPL